MSQEPVTDLDGRQRGEAAQVRAREARAGLRQAARLRDRSGGVSPRDYNLTISHEHQLIWFRNAKVGTRSILHHLGSSPHAENMLVLSAVPFETTTYATYFKFGFVRDPLERFISAWRDKVVAHNKYRFSPKRWEKMQTVENFARWVGEQDLRDIASTDRHVMMQSALVDLTQVDFLGRMESFDDDLATVCERIGLPVVQQVRRNSSEQAGSALTADTASAELRDVVEDIYALDYQVFGYQRRTAGTPRP